MFLQLKIKLMLINDFVFRHETMEGSSGIDEFG
jgi:hypothetical protein